MTRTDWLIILAAVLVELLCCLEWAPEAHADEAARVDASQLCAVKSAIRFHERAWTAPECERVAASLNETRDPVQMTAICTAESDLRERAQRVTLLPDGRLARDIGLCGVRCVTEPDAKESDRCTNGAARGLYANQLLDPAVNVRTAAAVLASHGGSLQRYNGGTRERGYAKRIHAIEAALGGVMVPGLKGRIGKLCRQIVEAVGKERRS